MRESDYKNSMWRFPPDLAAFFGFFYIILPIAVVTGWLLPPLANAKSQGDTTLLYFAMALGVIGTALLFCARWPLYRQRRFFALGPGALSGRHRKLYSWAYV